MSKVETFVGIKVNGEYGIVEFERADKCEITGFTGNEVFVSFNNHCIDIIDYGTPYVSYLKGERIKQQLKETWVDRHIDC